MATTTPAVASPTPPLQVPAVSVSATSPRASPRQATAAVPRHTRNHTQSTNSPSRFSRLRSWVGRTKLYLGAAIGILTLVVTIISLIPSFAGGIYGKKTLELALWTVRKDYVEACQEYLNHTTFGCQQALEKGLPPPPGRDRIATRSPQRLQEEVQRLKFQPLIHKAYEHIFWLRLWLQIGAFTVVLILTGQLARFKYFLRRQRTRPLYPRPRNGLDLATLQREFRGVPVSRLWNFDSLSHATATGLDVKEGQVTSIIEFRKAAATGTFPFGTSTPLFPEWENLHRPRQKSRLLSYSRLYHKFP